MGVTALRMNPQDDDADAFAKRYSVEPKPVVSSSDLGLLSQERQIPTSICAIRKCINCFRLRLPGCSRAARVHSKGAARGEPPLVLASLLFERGSKERPDHPEHRKRRARMSL